MRKITMKELLNNTAERAFAGAAIGGIIGKALEDKVEVLRYIPVVNVAAKTVQLSTTAVATLGGLTIGAVAGVGETIVDAARDVA